MTEEHRNPEPRDRECDLTRRPWEAPTLEVVFVGETDGPLAGFPLTDSITGVS